MPNKPMNQFPKLAAVPMADGFYAIAHALVNADGTHLQSLLGPRLIKGGAATVSRTLTSANTDYAAAAPMPAGAKYVVIFCAAAVIVAMGEATSTSVGVNLAAATPRTFPVTVSGVSADDTIHAQSPSAGAVIYYTYMLD